MREITEDIIGVKTKNKYYACENGYIFSEYSNRYLSFDITKEGYLRVYIAGKNYLVHRIIAKCFIENPDNKPEVNHKDCNKKNNHVENLEWVTRKENNNYSPTYLNRVKNIKRGEDNNFSRLTEREVLEIIKLLEYGEDNNYIAEIFNVTPKTIRNIKNLKTWKHIPR